MTRVRIKNTFLEFGHEDEENHADDDWDPWAIDFRLPRRQCTDSVLERVSGSGREWRASGVLTPRDPLAREPENWRSKNLPHATEWVYQEHPQEHVSVGPDQDDELSDELDQNMIMEATAAVAGRRADMDQFDVEIKDIPNTGSNLNGRTTVMMRNIPCKYTPHKVMKEINHAGFLGRYDFFYLPMDPRSRSNRGFSFINLDCAAAAEDFFQIFDGKKLRGHNSDKVIAVLPAEMQGFERNAYHFASQLKVRRKRNGETGPLFFRLLPPALEEGMNPHADVEFPSLLESESYRTTRKEQYHEEDRQAGPPSCGVCKQKLPPHHVFCTLCGGRAKTAA